MIFQRTEPFMGTVVTIQVVRDGEGVEEAVERAFDWFQEVEERCTRFRPDSELVKLGSQVGRAVAPSPLLFEALQFALLVAEECGGAFDPTVGRRMESLGFDREYATGQVVRTGTDGKNPPSYRDVVVDPKKRTVRLNRPLTLDLGAIAKGFAVDLASRELMQFRDFCVDAGGDLYLGGLNPKGEPWAVGIRHPRIEGAIFDTIRVSNSAVCTSGDYERPGHVVDPQNPESKSAVCSVSVVAPNAMLADGLATAAMVMGLEKGLPFLEQTGVDSLMILEDLTSWETGNLRRGA